jgi:hypothetical protein
MQQKPPSEGTIMSQVKPILLPVKNQFWGDRTGQFVDPSGHVWTISTQVEETSAEARTERWSSILKR